MNDKYILHWRFDLDIKEHTSEYDSLTEAEQKMNQLMKFHNDLEYIKITWGDTVVKAREY